MRATRSAKENGKIMLWQMKKILQCHFPDLTDRLSSLDDPRKVMQYTIEEMVMAALVLFILKSKSRNDFNLKSNEIHFQENYYRIFRLNLPGMDAVNELLEKIEPHELEALNCHFVSALIKKRVFHNSRFFGKYFYIAVDGSGAYNWGDTPPKEILPYALKRESSKGTVSYTGQILVAVLVCSNGMYIPFVTEWIANDGQKYEKQDCEMKAFKRLAAKLKEYFPKLNICILADGLYSNVTIMDICQQNGWKFITVFKDGNLPSVWEEVNSLLSISQKGCNREQEQRSYPYWIKRNYQWIKDLPYQKHTIHWMECVQETTNSETQEKKESRFVFLTNLDVNYKNVVDILMAGRARWWIEEHFNTLKNRGGALHHKFNRKNFDALKNWHSVRQLACMMIQLLQHTQELQLLKKQKGMKMTWQQLWDDLCTLFKIHEIEEIIAEIDIWCSKKRQVRLE